MSVVQDIRSNAARAWNRLTQREQAALVLMGLALALFAVYLLIVRPAIAFQQTAEAQLQSEQARLGRIMAMLDSADGGQAVSIDRSKPPRTRVLAAARRVGIVIDQVEPQADGFRVFVRNIPPADLFSWLADIENRQAVPIINADISKALSGTALDAEIGFGDRR